MRPWVLIVAGILLTLGGVLWLVFASLGEVCFVPGSPDCGPTLPGGRTPGFVLLGVGILLEILGPLWAAFGQPNKTQITPLYGATPPVYGATPPVYGATPPQPPPSAWPGGPPPGGPWPPG